MADPLAREMVQRDLIEQAQAPQVGPRGGRYEWDGSAMTFHNYVPTELFAFRGERRRYIAYFRARYVRPPRRSPT